MTLGPNFRTKIRTDTDEKSTKMYISIFLD